MSKRFKGVEQINTDVGHELFACSPDLLRKGGTEHHHLFVMRCRPEYFLHIATHV